MLTLFYYYYYLLKYLLLYYIILYRAGIKLKICFFKKAKMNGLSRRNGDEKPMLTYALTLSFLKLWFSFPDLLMLKIVIYLIHGFQNVNVNVNVSEFFLKIWGVLTNMLTLFLIDSKRVFWFVNVNVNVICNVTLDYQSVNVNVGFPLFSFYC